MYVITKKSYYFKNETSMVMSYGPGVIHQLVMWTEYFLLRSVDLEPQKIWSHFYSAREIEVGTTYFLVKWRTQIIYPR